MGARVGRPAAPTPLKIVRGDRKSRINNTEPQPTEAKVTAPSWLSTPAKRIWRRLAPDLERRGVLTAWDCDSFAVWCDAVAQHQTAAKLIAAEGLLVEGQRGGMVKHPAAQLVRDYAAIMTTFGSRFGLTPSDRSALKVGGNGESPDAKARYLS